MPAVSFDIISDDIFPNISAGEVKSYQIKRGSSVDDEHGLSSVELFGPTRDYYCCDRVVTETYTDAQGKVYRKCSRCGHIVYPSTVREDIRSFINLSFPLISPVLAGDHGKYLGRILGIKADTMKEICYATIGYNITDGTFPYVNQVSKEDAPNILLQGELARKLIDQFDIVDARYEELLSLISKQFFRKGTPYSEIGRISNDQSGIKLVGGYYLHLAANYKEWLKRTIKTDLSADDVTSYIQLDCIRSPFTRLSLLMNLSSKDILYKMIVTKVTVTPAGTRPEIDQRHDPLTLAYTRIMHEDSMIQRLSQKPSFVDRATRIGNLYKALRNLLIEDDSNNDGKRSIKEKISGKEGFIRNKMAGKRTDWSGRSVIIIDPDLSLDQCSVPYEVAKVIFEFHLKAMHVDTNNDVAVRKALEDHILKHVPVILNRAPTLHRLSLRAFWVVLSPKRAIGLNPLVCDGYNADFDGDQMGIHVPLSEKAIFEATELLMSTRNIHTPASGNISITPKQELVYGLYELTKYKKEDSKNHEYRGSADSLADVYALVINHSLKACDIVTCDGKTDYAGKLALYHCLPPDMHTDMGVITKGSLGGLMRKLTNRSVAQYSDCLSRLIHLAFAVATLYAPTMSLLGVGTENINSVYDDFFKEIHDYAEEFANGFECAEHYNSTYSYKQMDTQEVLSSRLSTVLGKDNGYVALVDSGARGDRSNLSQIYGAKGRIAKSSVSAFNLVITSSFLSQLNATEHFISAYGTRKTMIDKVQKTGDTGDAMRRMSHANPNRIITTEDCGTTRGITFSIQEVARFLPRDANGKLDTRAASKVVIGCVAGRYEAVTNKYLTEEDAAKILETQQAITIRSILTCNDPCCAKCYGVDLTYMRPAARGTPIGYIAAQSIGEPGTQLTMRTFHSGGVAGKADVTSAFDRMEALIDHTARDNYRKNSTYDPIAWASGEVIEEVTGLEKRVSIKGHPKTITLPAAAQLKSYVEIPESPKYTNIDDKLYGSHDISRIVGLCVQEGEHDVREVETTLGVNVARMYLLLSLYSVYLNQASINIKHFEVLVDGMTRYLCVDAPLKDAFCHFGETLSTSEYENSDTSKYTFIKKIYSVAGVPRYGTSYLAHMAYAYIMEALFLVGYLNAEDPMEDAYGRIIYGLPPKVGTYYESYIGERRDALYRNSIL